MADCNQRRISRSLFEVPVFVALLLCMLQPESASEAQARGRGGGGGGGRNMARGSVHQSNVSRNANVNRNVNVNQNVNVNRNVHVHGGYHGGGYGYDRWGHPVAAAVAVTTAAIAVGTIVASLPPQCTATVMGNVTYQSCGGTYYQPVYHGTTVQYVVVNPP